LLVAFGCSVAGVALSYACLPAAVGPHAVANADFIPQSSMAPGTPGVLGWQLIIE